MSPRVNTSQWSSGECSRAKASLLATGVGSGALVFLSATGEGFRVQAVLPDCTQISGAKVTLLATGESSEAMASLSAIGGGSEAWITL